ncbi:MAG: hypothetical protein M3463_12835 [Verrucomicrobiota bacterium]|nr:hypothetical protein [Verrucomicrobiota bacterium]
MNRATITLVSLSLTAALATTGCENLSPGASAGVFGGISGLAAGGIARAAGASTAESIAIGAATGAVVAVATYIIAKRRATERQRRIAEARARTAYARLQSREAQTRTSGRRPTKKRPRYIAVDTVRDERTSPKAKKSVMIWDTQSREIVGNNVYDVEQAPPVGSTARFETYSAEYVGSGG